MWNFGWQTPRGFDSEKSCLFDHVDPISDFLWIPKPIFPFDDSEKSFDDSEKSFLFDALQWPVQCLQSDNENVYSGLG